jgi:hypothetical protein
VFENRVLRRIFEPEEEATEDWRKLYNEELHNVCCSPNVVRATKSRRMRWVRRGARTGGMRHAYRMLAGKSEGQEPRGRHP